MPTIRGVARWFLPVIAIVATVAAASGAYSLAGWSWERVVEYRSPYAPGEIPPAESAEPLAGRLVLVIVDGLRQDASREMQSIERLRDIGADLTLVVEQPSLSYPAWTTLLSGAPRNVSGVTTNWFEERVPVETLLDTAIADGLTVGVVGPSSFETLYGAERADAEYFADWKEGEYLSARLVDEALRIERGIRPDLLLVHLPDVDEAGHDAGGASKEYADVVRRVDGDLARLVEGTQDAETVYAIVADHGHISSGGHGGWEPDVVRAAAVVAGDGVRYTAATARQTDLAPTLSVLLGVPSPRHATGEALSSVLSTTSEAPLRPSRRQRLAFADEYTMRVQEPTGEFAEPGWTERTHGRAVDDFVREAEARREAFDRRQRLPYGAAVAGAALLALVFVGLASWRGLVAALSGAGVYHAVYNAAFFLLHGHRWSLSAFNSEDLIQSFFNARMAEAALAGLTGAAAAAVVYGLLRGAPHRPAGRFLPGWLALGPVTALAAQATLALQVAWFLWWYGPDVTWRMPDFGWAFKYDLDLVQTTALGAAALLSPVVTWLVGRYHPRVRRAEEARRSASEESPGSFLGGDEEAASPRRAG